MKQYISIALLTLIALSFASCDRGPKVITERYLVRFSPPTGTDSLDKGQVYDIETLQYADDSIAIAKEYERFEEFTKSVVERCKEFRHVDTSDPAEKDSIAVYGKLLTECRYIVIYRHEPGFGSEELLNAVKENGADINSDVKFAKEKNLRVQFIPLHNDVWLRELNDDFSK